MNILYKIFKGTKVIAEGALCAFSKEEGFRKVYNKAKGKVRPFEYHKLSIEINNEIQFKFGDIFKESVARKLQTRIRLADFWGLFLGAKSPHKKRNKKSINKGDLNVKPIKKFKCFSGRSPNC